MNKHLQVVICYKAFLWRFCVQRYTEETFPSEEDPSQPPVLPLQHYLERPIHRIQKYQTAIKVWLVDVHGVMGEGRALSSDIASHGSSGLVLALVAPS